MALCVGLLANSVRAKPLPLLPVRAPTLPTVTREDVLAITRGEQPAILIDARPPVFYRLGHIPGALNLSRKAFEEAYARLKPQLKPGARLIVYCSGNACEDSHAVAAALRERGHPDVAIYTGGWEEWSENE